MANTYLYLRLHLIWSVKNREARLETAWRGRLFGYLSGICEKKGCRLIIGGGTADHVHLCVRLSSNVSVAQIVNALKANSSRWIHENVSGGESFAWQEGYAALTIGRSGEGRLVEYIRNQEKHHARRDYAEELRGFLEKYGVEWDERYLTG